MKVTLEFTRPDEDFELDLALNGSSYKAALHDIYQYLRGQRKYVEPSAQDNIEGVWTRFFDILEDNKVDVF